MNDIRYQNDKRFELDREELAELIAHARQHDGNHDIRPGINVGRYSSPTELYHGFLDPCLCVIAEGAKVLTLGDESYRYDSAHYMIATVGVPMIAQVIEATQKRPNRKTETTKPRDRKDKTSDQMVRPNGLLC